MAIKKGENIYRPVGIHIDLTDDEDDYILVGEFPAGHELTPGERLEGIPTTRVELSLEDRDALIAAAKASPVFAEGYGVIAAHPEFADAEPGEA